MKHTIKIRKALLDELDLLLAFEQGIIEAERPYGKSLKAGHINYYDLAALIRNEEAEVLVAEVDNTVVGSGYAKLIETKPYYAHSRQSYLGFMYVDPNYRGLGVNRKIIDALLQWSRDQGVAEAILDVYAENTTAVRAYEKAGFEPHLLEMRLALNDQ